MDRQSLLEKKRQRLQELKLKRVGGIGTTNENRSLEDLVDSLQRPTDDLKRISVAIQTDVIVESKQSEQSDTVDISPTKRGNHVTYDKAIQVDPVVLDVIENKPLSINEDQKEVESDQPANEEEIDLDETNLNPQLTSSLKRLNKVLADDADYPSLFADFSKTVPLKIDSKDSDTNKNTDLRLDQYLPSVPGRSVVSIDVSSQGDDIMVVSYSSDSKQINRLDTKHKKSPATHIRSSLGLAVIYSLKNNKPFPEFFLECTTAITIIKFDKTTNSKIMGGLSDGTVVVWDLAEIEANAISILPTLKTSVISSIGASLANRGNNTDGSAIYSHHTSPIIHLDQVDSDTNASLISISTDGIINVWSTSLLASPKLNSVKLTKANESDYLNSNIAEPILIGKAMIVGNNSLTSLTKYKKSAVSHEPEYKFLDRMIIGSVTGTIYKLENNKETNNIESIHEPTNHKIHDEFQISKINSMVEVQLNNEPMILSSHLDWCLRLWNLSTDTPIATIPTSTIITDICVRSSHPHQFVTTGFIHQNELTPVIQFWDLNCKMWSPIREILYTEYKDVNSNPNNATTVKFNSVGDKFIVGFDDGSASVFLIDDGALNETIKYVTEPEIDDGATIFLGRSK